MAAKTNQENPSKPKYDAAYWAEEIKAFEKRSKDWRKSANSALSRFLDTQSSGSKRNEVLGDSLFRSNLYHQHITTLLSMLYGTMPKVEVNRRHKDPDDDVARVGGLMINRILNSDIESGGEDFASMLRGALQDRLIAGLGQCRVRYEAEIESIDRPAETDSDGNIVREAYKERNLVSEEAPIDYIHWEDFAWGYARTWKEVPWVGFRSRVSRPKAEKRFGADVAKNLNYDRRKAEDGDSITSGKDMEDPTDTAEVWEIWCKSTRKVHWVQPDSHNGDKMLDEKDDPLKLEDFWPCPPPMIANATTKLYMPMTDLKLTQDFYDEIDLLQTRIHFLTKALKVVGLYDKRNNGIQRMLLEGSENELIPVDNWAMFAEMGGIKGAVDFFPVEVVAETLDRVRNIRNETVMLLYQVTGLQDIMQGNLTGGQPTSATEQALRAKFASVRVQYLQDSFARFASNLQAIKAEVIGLHFSPKTIAQQSRINMTSGNMQHILPAIQLIKSGVNSRWAIEIKPESIAMIDYAQLKAERTEYLTALSTFLQSAQAMGKVAPSLGPMLIQLLKWGLAGFKGSAEIEGVIDQALDMLNKEMEAARRNPKPDPEQQKAQMAMAKDKAKFEQDMMKEMAKHRDEMQKMAESFKHDLLLLLAKTQGKLTEEAVQAHYGILEKKAAGGRGERAQ